MRKILTAVALVLALVVTSNVFAASKHTRKRATTRPQWNGYYNGYGWAPGYHYDPNAHMNWYGGFWYADGYRGPLPGNHSNQFNKPPSYHPGGAVMGFPG